MLWDFRFFPYNKILMLATVVGFNIKLPLPEILLHFRPGLAMVTFGLKIFLGVCGTMRFISYWLSIYIYFSVTSHDVTSSIIMSHLTKMGI
jgi:hypothetical protein